MASVVLLCLTSVIIAVAGGLCVVRLLEAKKKRCHVNYLHEWLQTGIPAGKTSSHAGFI